MARGRKPKNAVSKLLSETASTASEPKTSDASESINKNINQYPVIEEITNQTPNIDSSQIRFNNATMEIIDESGPEPNLVWMANPHPSVKDGLKIITQNPHIRCVYVDKHDAINILRSANAHDCINNETEYVLTRERKRDFIDLAGLPIKFNHDGEVSFES